MGRAGSWWFAGSICTGLCVRNCLSGNPCPEIIIVSGVAAGLAISGCPCRYLVSGSPFPAGQHPCKAVRSPSISTRDLLSLHALLGIPATLKVRFGFLYTPELNPIILPFTYIFCPEACVRKSLSGDFYSLRGYSRESGDTCPLAGVISFHPVPYMVILSPWKLP